MIKIKFFLLLFIVSACANINTKDDNKFSTEDLVGNWKLDKFSYNYLKKENFKDSISMLFKADSSFYVNNSRDLFMGEIDGKPAAGKWKIIDVPKAKHKYLLLTYNNRTTQSGFNIVRKEGNLQIWYFFGDPDSGRRLRFLKSK